MLKIVTWILLMVAADNNVTENHLLEARSKEPDTDGIQYKKPYK